MPCNFSAISEENPSACGAAKDRSSARATAVRRVLFRFDSFFMVPPLFCRTGRIARRCLVLQYVVSFNIAIQGLCHFLKNAFQESFIELHAPAFFVTRACSRHEAQIKHFRYVITFQFRKEEEKHIHYPCKMNAKIIPRVHVNSTQYN